MADGESLFRVAMQADCADFCGTHCERLPLSGTAFTAARVDRFQPDAPHRTICHQPVTSALGDCSFPLGPLCDITDGEYFAGLGGK